MRRLIIVFLTFCLVGCLSMPTNPHRSVDLFFNNLEVDLNYLDFPSDINLDQQQYFKDLLQANLDQLTYQIIYMRVTSLIANVAVQVRVFDYSDIDNKLDQISFDNNNERFNKKLKLMNELDTKKYSRIILRFEKVERNWQIQRLSKNTILKIHGFH